MKSKILEFLKNKYKTLGFSDKAFEGVAEFLAHTITKEEDIEAGAANVENLLKGLQGDIDKRVTDAITKTKNDFKKSDDKKPDDDNKKDVADDKDTPPWAKALIESNKELQKRVELFEKKDKTTSHLSVIQKKLTEAKVPESYYNTLLEGKELNDDAEVDALATKIVTSWTTVKQSFADEGLGLHEKPLLGNPNSDGVDSQTAAYIKRRTAEKGESSLGGKPLN